jgi:hypothetical protein
VAAGALASAYRIPPELETAYGNRPFSYMLFVRTSVR